MDSQDLVGIGFKTWLPFNVDSEAYVLARVPNEPGVYAIRRRETFARVRGASDLLYIGSATAAGNPYQSGLRLRLRQYFHPGPTQRTNMRLKALIAGSKEYEIGYAVVPSKAIATELEADLIERYEKEHGERPRENHNSPQRWLRVSSS